MNTAETVSKQAAGLQNFLLAMPRAPALVHLATTRNAQALALWRCFCRGELGERELVSMLADLAALLGKAGECRAGVGDPRLFSEHSPSTSSPPLRAQAFILNRFRAAPAGDRGLLRA